MKILLGSLEIPLGDRFGFVVPDQGDRLHYSKKKEKEKRGKEKRGKNRGDENKKEGNNKKRIMSEYKDSR